MEEENKSLEEEYEELLKTIELYPKQIKQSWDEVYKMNFPKNYEDVLNVVVCGMGGSALGARMLKSLLLDRFKVPIEIINDYHMPYFVGERSLVIVSSYSGGTEETVNCANEAIRRNVKLFGITTGSRLGDILKDAGSPSYIFDPVNNPSKQPRNATGYFIGSLIALFSKLNLVDMSENEVVEAINYIEEFIKDVKDGGSNFSKDAKDFAKKLKGKLPVLVSSEHLYGAAHIFKNQLNESAKTFSVHFPIPELNHHLMEGLKNPKFLNSVY